MDCICCWPPEAVEIKNSKYCKLQSKYQTLTKNQNSTFGHCKTLYTKCDYLLEQSVHEAIIKLEKLFKEYQKLVIQEGQIQKELINDMWIQNQRYLLLTRSGVCVKSYPEVISFATEKDVFCDFYTSLRKIKRSNCLLAQSMENILVSQSELNVRCKQLDMAVGSPFINCAYYLNSLSYIRTVLNDLLHYFYSNLCKMKYWAHLLDLEDSVSIEDYMHLIKSNKENDSI